MLRSVSQAESRKRPVPTDRRVRRTRRALQDALVALVLQHGFDSLTIDQIAERADIGRATFYLHFSDKTDLLMSITDDLVGGLVTHLATQRTNSHGSVVRATLRHVEANQEAYRVLLSGIGDGRPLDRAFELANEFGEGMISRLATERQLTMRVPLKAAARIWSGQLIAVIRWWASGTSGYTAQEMADMLVQTRFYGLSWVYGLEEGDQTLAANELGDKTDPVQTNVRTC